MLQDQWQRKKQTKEEFRTAKLAKFNPHNAKSAKDVMARKRKRDHNDELSNIEEAELRKTNQKLTEWRREPKKPKRHDNEVHKEHTATIELREPRDGVNRTIKSQVAQKICNNSVQVNKLTEVQAQNVQENQRFPTLEIASADFGADGKRQAWRIKTKAGDDIEKIDISSTRPVAASFNHATHTATPSSGSQSPTFDLSGRKSGASSILSMTLTVIASKTKSNDISFVSQNPKHDSENLKARLQQKIDGLRTARKANAIDGTSARNRQELIEVRRKKEEQRRANKIQNRQKAREEEQRQRYLTLSRGSPLLAPVVGLPGTGLNVHPSPPNEQFGPSDNLSFGRIALENGQALNANLNEVVDLGRRKRPQDPRTAFQSATNHAKRMHCLEPLKRAEIADKDIWLKARRKARGEKLRDDTLLLKKTLKRKEKAKNRSEKQWEERVENVEHRQAMKQRRKEENLRKRKEEDGRKGKKGAKQKVHKKAKSKARPGFEGSFKARIVGGRKKA